MENWFKYCLFLIFIGFAVLVIFMTGCAYNCRSYTQYKLEQVSRDIEEARNQSVISSDYNWNVVRLFDELDTKVKALYRDRK